MNAAQIFTAAAIGLLSFASTLDAASTLYGIDYNPGFASYLYTLSTSNGELTRIGSTGVTNLTDLTSDQVSTLWAVQQTTNALVTINPITGVGTVGPTITGTGLSASIPIYSIAWDPLSGVLYGNTSLVAGNTADTLYSINPTTGAATLIGKIGFSDVYALGFGQDGTLWGIEDSSGSNDLISINLTTGAGTSVGSSGISGAFDIASDPAGSGLYVAEGNTSALYKVTPGAGTVTATEVGPYFTYFANIAGLAFLDPGSAPAVAAFLDQYGAPALTFNGWTTFPDAGGLLNGLPGVAQASNGDTYIVGLDSAGGVHLNTYSHAEQIWNGWQYSGGILDTTSGLTAAVAPDGVLWFTGRDVGNRYWINSWNGTSFGGWILLDRGTFSSDSIPQIAIPSDGSVYVIGKDIGGRVWSNSYIPATQMFTGWLDRQAIIIGQPSAAAGQDGMVYVAVRSVANNSPVYITQIPTSNGPAANTWLNGGGLIDTDPQIASVGGTVYLTALAGGGSVYLLTFAESNQTYGAWTFTNGILSDETIADAGGSVYIAGRDSGDRVYWYSVSGNSWFFAGGAGMSSTVLTGGK